MDYSVLFPQQPADPRAIDVFAGVVRHHRLSRLWMGQSFAIESHLALAASGADGVGVPVGIGTALAALRSPYDAAMQARSLAAVIRQPVAVAYGAADPEFVSSVSGSALSRPAAYTAEYCRLVRALVDGHVATSTADRLQMNAVLPPLDHPRVDIGTGVLRPGMARKSASVADFVITWLTPEHYLRETLIPALTRPDGTRPRLVAHVHCAVDRPGRNARLLAQVGCSGHLSRPHYVSMLRSAGLDIDVSDPVSGARMLVQHGVIAIGSAVEIAERLDGFAASGVDEVVINATAVALTHGDTAAVDDLEEIAASLRKGTSHD
ncbi:LLM class flavin-dependent oxidoreductase [Intrasporangium sp. DVR]|uniref:LLM class flavin-dependent oxidoreductase n=1 Tax=Intrasporangium sp. DVR TaxID=3127867 RepID=UPI00313A5742